jgi:hypothetical protein
MAVYLIVSPLLSAFIDQREVQTRSLWKRRSDEKRTEAMAFLWKLRLVSLGVWKKSEKPAADPGLAKK